MEPYGPEASAYTKQRLTGQCVVGSVEYIKGNRSSMIYHGPTGQFYDRTNAEDCFYTDADARAAGYRPSKR